MPVFTTLEVMSKVCFVFRIQGLDALPEPERIAEKYIDREKGGQQKESVSKKTSKNTNLRDFCLDTCSNYEHNPKFKD